MCVNCQSFYGNPANENLCSKCHKEKADTNESKNTENPK